MLNDKFPPKRMFGSNSDSTVNERKVGLELWLNYVLRTPSETVRGRTAASQLRAGLMRACPAAGAREP